MKPTTRDGILRGGIAALVRLLIVAAAGISAYLLSVSLSGGSAVGCGPGSACDEVLQSRWAYVAGVPVSALALVTDLTLLLATFACGPKSSAKQRRGAWEMLLPCSVLVLGAGLWFIALQAFVLHRFCPWCMAAHLCGAAAAILLLARLPVTSAPERAEKEPRLRSSSAIKLGVAAVVAIALLGVAQVMAPRKTYSVTTIPEGNKPRAIGVGNSDVPLNAVPPKPVLAVTNASAGQAVAAALSNATAAGKTNDSGAKFFETQGMLGLFGGRIMIDLKSVPIWGPPSAPAKLISLYDYTCHHCRDMHPHVANLRRTFGDRLAIVSLPMPLDGRCNPLIRRTPRAHENACTYARLGLTVWRAKHSAIEEFDDWLFSFPSPPLLTDVTNKAVDLVGLMAFDAASRDPSIEQALRTSIGIYTINGNEFKQGNMPQFMIGSNLLSGTPTGERLQAFVAPHVQPTVK